MRSGLSGAEFLRDIRPGEMVTVTENEVISNTELCRDKQAHCIFEYIYFARLDSTLDGINIYDARIRAGTALAQSFPAEADLVCGVCRTPASLRRRDIPKRPASRSGWPFIKTAMWAGPLSNPPRKNG